MRDTLLLIGNGLAIDYRSQFQEMPDPSNPLDLPLPTPGISRPLRATFSELWRIIEALRGDDPGISDFRLMERLRLLPRPPPPAADFLSSDSHVEFSRSSHARALIETQLRLHLTHAYTRFTQLIGDADLRAWRWHSWFSANKDRVHSAVSFNYDLLLEKALQSVIPVRYLVGYPTAFGINPEVAVFKPHGSINFEFSREGISVGGDSQTIYDRKYVIELNDVTIRILGASELDCQRVNADIVLPTEASRIRRFQYIAPGFHFLKLTRNEISRCIIVGLSYWDCDRREINEILSYLMGNTQIIICNPDPPKEMVEYVRERFRHVEMLTTGLPV
jgi:hypothetical protein